jgi:MobA/VirD2-like, nuclease domain/Large polyvalent protein-associated domain 7/TraI-like middle domain
VLCPVSSARKDGRTSFRSLKNYIITEIDPESGKAKFRGDHLLSDNLLSLETAHLEMRAVAVNNARVKNPVFHFQITWQKGEIPTRVQWEEAVRHSLRVLGFDEHQFVSACHDNTENFHVHMMINRVHPENYRAHMPRLYMHKLHKAMREIEQRQGWREDNGIFRWDAGRGEAVLNTPEEMAAIQAARGKHSTGKAAKMEHYNDVESFQSYVRHSATRQLHELLQRQDVRWVDVHQLLASKGLMLEKGEKGGYTVRAVNQDIRAKASDVFRQNFAGKANRAALEQHLGTWQAPDPSKVKAETEYARRQKKHPTAVRDPLKRAEQEEQRREERESLKREFYTYRSERRAAQKNYTETVRARRKALIEALKTKKVAIRANRDVSWLDRRAAISMAIAETVIQQRLLAVRAHKERLRTGPVTYQLWVQQKAVAGDKRAIAQMRGWRYQDQRNVRRIEREIAEGARTTMNLMGEDANNVLSWEKLSNDDVREMEHAESVAQVMSSMRMAVHKGTGHVTYMLKGTTAFVDRGKTISVMTRDEAATVLALEMAVKKYGPRITARGSEKWRQELARIAARNNVFIEFTDPDLQRILQDEKTRLVSRLMKVDWTRESGGIEALPPSLSSQAKKEYMRWATVNPKAATTITLADYVAFRQGPRAATYRAQAAQYAKIRENLLRTQATLELRNDDEARIFIQGIYGPRGSPLLAARVESTRAAQGKPVETNLHNLAILTTTLQKDGKIDYRVRPADSAQAMKQTEDLAGIFRQSASEAQRLAATPPQIAKKSEPETEERRGMSR